MFNVLLLAVQDILVRPSFWDHFVVWTWLSTAAVATVGAAYLGWAGFRDRVFSRHSSGGPRHTIREENSGILMRSGMNRALQGTAYVLAGAIPIIRGGLESHVSAITGILAIGLSGFSAYATLRDIAARVRIGSAVNEL